MKNLKKVLALVLAFACAFTMFAGAAFTDEADFAVDTEVVDTLVALGVIEGYTDGSFQPDATVTRAEMAKMIYVVRTGRSDASAYNNDATTFTDITDHWARGYIKYCQSLGIIAGKSATSFDPDATVTTQEAAKMLLVTLGYNADKAGLVGTGWGAKTTALADENGLLKDVNCGTTQGMPRQYAAQLIYNSIFSYTVVLRDGEYTNMNLLGAKNPTIGEKYMSLVKDEWVLDGYKDKKAVFTANANTKDKSVKFEDYTVDKSELVDKAVTVLYKMDTKTDKATIYGMFKADDNTYMDTIVGQITDRSKTDTIKVGGTKYDIADDASKAVKEWADSKSAQPATVVLDKNGDVYDITKDTDFAVGKVTFVGTKTVTVGGKSYNVEDVDMYDGMAKDDWAVVSVSDYTNNTVFTKATVVSGKVDVVNGDDYTIDGTVYTKANDSFVKSISGLELGNKVDVVVVNGYIYNAEKVSGIASLEEVVYINGTKTDNNYGKKTVKAQAIFANGTTAEIKVVDIEGTKGDALYNAVDADDTSKKFNGLYAFDLDDDEYTLNAITSGTDKDDFEVAEGTTATAGDDKISGLRVNDDAVVFVVDKDGDVSVKTGKEVAAWNAVTVEKVNAFANKTNGVAYVELAAVVMKSNQDIPGSSSDAVYGYVVKTLGSTKEDNTTYNSYEVWTSTGLQTIKVKAANDFGAAKKDFVKFENDKLTKSTAKVAAITGLAGDSVYFDNDSVNEYVITDDTQIVYINVEDVEGVEGGSLVVADDLDGDNTKEKNVAFEAETTKNSDGAYELKVVFVDVNNDIQNVI
ncbi:S-layer homology domain-containing protein [Agathobaculum sp. Marseille-P7918]|uniref:S-layer homology domain-containing protein n=1 Tax=Agathobaculum sp. Marseille-P7918 TaxID=2479843 RepID=UPI000F62C77A|nr:S-layer homology domain-containing protein [Agathobaculum sp. Marseille-P7918]